MERASRPPPLGIGAGAGAALLSAAGFAGAAPVALLACAPDWAAASTSAWTMRPEGPEPVRAARSTPFSPAIFLARGEAKMRPPSWPLAPVELGRVGDGGGGLLVRVVGVVARALGLLLLALGLFAFARGLLGGFAR